MAHNLATQAQGRLPAPPRSERIRGRFRRVATVLSLPAILSLCLEHGFVQPPIRPFILHIVQGLAIGAYVASVVAGVVTASTWMQGLKRYGVEVAFALMGAALLIGESELEHVRFLSWTAGYVVIAQTLIVIRVAIGAVRINLELSQRTLRPGRLLLGIFLTVMFAGGCLLSLPKAVTEEVRADPVQTTGVRMINSFFTSVSATCVTGLIVYDTGHDFSRFGQVVILVLIQLGGLGIMIFSTVVSMLVGMQLSVRQSLVLQDELSHRTIGQMGQMVRFVLIVTLGFEALGALSLYPVFSDITESTGDAVFSAIFHSVSAFCNAGFALESDSLIGLRGHWSLYTTIMPLIVFGGLGFPVLRDIALAIKARVRKPSQDEDVAKYGVWRQRSTGRRHILSLHTKLVLTTTLALIVVPAIMFFAIESTRPAAATISVIQAADSSAPIAGTETAVMRKLSVTGRLDAAIFLSVTARTAGFNTVAMDERSLSKASHFLLTVLMFIGGSPASTAGGIKTVTLAVLVLSVWRTLRGRNRVEAFHRAIDERTIARAAALIVVMFLLGTVAVLLLSITEETSIRSALFESISALGTVGLSTGLTDQLTVAGRVIIMLAMLAGRLGPLTLLIALAGSTSEARYEYPIENVAIG